MEGFARSCWVPGHENGTDLVSIGLGRGVRTPKRRKVGKTGQREEEEEQGGGLLSTP